jgi:hypothetical protein
MAAHRRAAGLKDPGVHQLAAGGTTFRPGAQKTHTQQAPHLLFQKQQLASPQDSGRPRPHDLGHAATLQAVFPSPEIFSGSRGLGLPREAARHQQGEAGSHADDALPASVAQ